jgi:mannose-6-phosphate isomerase-like protein (cupin superfamily)
MNGMHLLRTLAIVAALAPARLTAQAAAQPEPDPGVRLIRLINRPEIRVSRIELEGGAARATHAHDEVEYHVWVPLEGRLEITIAPDGPVVAEPGQAFFLTRGTQHGFRNPGSEPAAVMEIFVQQSSVSASREAAEELARVLAQIDTQRRGP